MAFGPESPEELDIRAGSCVGVESSRRGAVDATSGVATALEVRDGDVLNRAIALDWARDAVDFRAHIWVDVRLVEGVVLATDSGVVNVAMGSNGGSESEGRGNVLHCERLGNCTIRRSERQIWLKKRMNISCNKNEKECDAPVLDDLECRYRLREPSVI